MEGLPDYWGIETLHGGAIGEDCLVLWKDYPTTGVLKLFDLEPMVLVLYGHLEGLPDYWGIETILAGASPEFLSHIWKDYPTTGVLKQRLHEEWSTANHGFGRITRLLGY